jgi:anthranilate synthase/aminodeoxychorismate synthase-like glutamine amidotransferase
MSSKVLVIDNYDSFVYNLVQYLAELGSETLVIRNDEIQESEIEGFIKEKKITHILISPGPGRPKDAGISKALIEKLANKLPILGVCLGHQAIGELYGADLIKAPTLMHGKTSLISHNSKHPMFKDIPSSFTATRYHSLILDKESVEKNSKLIIEALSDDNLIMAISHRDYPALFGVQYHPESILSEYGHKFLSNFLNF